MSRIDDLIADLAPGGVRSRPMGEVGQFFRGRRFTKNDRVLTGIPSIHYGEIYTNYGTATRTARSHVREEIVDQLRFAEHGDVVFASVGETVEDVGKAVAWLGDSRVAIHDDCFAFRSEMDPMFVAYFSQTAGFKSQIERHVARAKVKRISAHSLAGVIIPLPPLEVQRDIVRVLNKFVQLEAELEAELEARRRQYRHYRDSLLTFREAGGVRWMPMGELGSIFGGLTGKSKADFADGNARFVSYMNVFRNTSTDTSAHDYVRILPTERQRSLQRGDMLFTGSSENAAEVGMSSVVTSEVNGPLFLNSFSIGVRPHDPELLEPGFAKHLLRGRVMRDQIVRTASGVTRFNVSKARLAHVLVPIPSRGVQVRIADRLDRFDTLVNDLSVGLPGELQARRKQYAHYRDRLLTFKEVAA